MSPENLKRIQEHDQMMIAAMRLKEYYECSVFWRGTTAESERHVFEKDSLICKCGKTYRLETYGKNTD